MAAPTLQGERNWAGRYDAASPQQERSGVRAAVLRAKEPSCPSPRARPRRSTGGRRVPVHSYDYDPDADKIGMQAAEALGEAPRRVLKTLIALVDGKPVCVIVRSDREVSMKKLAAAFGGKSAEMMKPAEAERIAGYKIGGVSPFGQTRRLRTAFDVRGARRALRLRQRRPARLAGAAESA